MPKRTEKFSPYWYAQQVRKLRALGALPKRGYKRLDRNQRRRVLYRVKKYRPFLGRTKDYEVVKKLTKLQRKNLKKVLPREYFTEKGVVIPMTGGTKGLKKPRISKTGELSFRMDELRSVIVPLDKKLFAQSPREAVKQALRGKRYQFVRILNNGYTLRANGDATDLKEFLSYYEKTLVPSVTDPNRRDGGMTAKEFSQVFTLELLAYKSGGGEYQFDEQIEELESEEQLELFLPGTQNAPPTIRRTSQFYDLDEDDEDDEDEEF